MCAFTFNLILSSVYSLAALKIDSRKECLTVLRGSKHSLSLETFKPQRLISRNCHLRTFSFSLCASLRVLVSCPVSEFPLELSSWSLQYTPDWLKNRPLKGRGHAGWEGTHIWGNSQEMEQRKAAGDLVPGVQGSWLCTNWIVDFAEGSPMQRSTLDCRNV